MRGIIINANKYSAVNLKIRFVDWSVNIESELTVWTKRDLLIFVADYKEYYVHGDSSRGGLKVGSLDFRNIQELAFIVNSKKLGIFLLICDIYAAFTKMSTTYCVVISTIYFHKY